MYIRKLNIEDEKEFSFFLWGARQTGKSTLLKYLFPDSLLFDLLLSDVFEQLHRNPSTLRETVLALKPNTPVIIDEIQRIPVLLNEIHWLIENTATKFILSGSSPRKIIRKGENLLGGRALRFELLPLSFSEIPHFDLVKALNGGLLPRHYKSKNHRKVLASYIGSYLQDEIIAEAKLRNISSFSRFLEIAALTNGEMINYTNIASECGVSSPTIKEYFQILSDTLLGRFLPSFQHKPKRRVIRAPKFYFFDIGVANYLSKQFSIEPGSYAFGKAFEHFIYLEIYAYSKYSGKDFPISYWRTASQLEIDFVLGQHEVGIEVKSSIHVIPRHLNGLLAFSEEYNVNKLIVVSRDPYPRLINNVLILPWKEFLTKLWNGEII